MAMKIDQTPVVEPHRPQTTVSASTSSAASNSSTKVSMFGAKSGFVIPKNKLSGALVPIFRGGKVDASDVTKKDSTKQAQRKTKWGIDMALDGAIRRGRALAYQTRVEQITQQLKSRVVEIGNDQGAYSPKETPNHDSSDQQIDKAQKLEVLELEKREIIGELLQLNPNYKVPPDYKPLLKEAKVPIPIKQYPGYNFIGLLLGPESNTQKRLEEETGAKICVQGTKSDTGEKKEITLSDADEAQGAYEELYVLILADTFEKVDAAVALIGLLVTPVSGSQVAVSTAPASISEDDGNAFGQSQDAATSFTMPAATVNQGVMQPIVGPMQPGPLRVPMQPYPGPWRPFVQPQTAMRPPSSFVPTPNSAMVMNSPIRFPPPVNPFNAPPFFGARPAGFSQIPRNPSSAVSSPQSSVPRPLMPEPRPLNQAVLAPGPQPLPAYPVTSSRPNSSVMAPFSANQPIPTGSTMALRPPLPSLQQPASTVPLGPPSNRPLTSMPAPGNPSGWSGLPPNNPPPFRPPNMMQMTPSVPSQRPLMGVQPIIASGTSQQNMPGTVTSRPPPVNVVPPPTFPSQPSTPQLPTTPVNNRPTFTPGPPHVGAHPTPILPTPPNSGPLVTSTSVAPAPSPTPPLLPSPAQRPLSVPSSVPAITPAPPSVLGQAPMQSSSAGPIQPVMARAPVVLIPTPSSQPAPSVSVSPPLPTIKPSIPSPVGVLPPVTTPKPQRPSSSDFTFQPQRPQLPANQNVQRPTSQPVPQNAPMAVTPTGIQPSAPQVPSFQPAVNNSAPPISMLGFPRSQGQAQNPSLPPNPTGPFANSQATSQSQPSAFLNPRPSPPTIPAPQMGPPSYLPAPQVHNPSGPMPIQPRNQLPLTNRPGSVMIPNQQFGSSLNYPGGRPTSSPSGGSQIYDPFSPTSISPAPSQQGNGGSGKGRKSETDAEYEDLMASVGVR